MVPIARRYSNWSTVLQNRSPALMVKYEKNDIVYTFLLNVQNSYEQMEASTVSDPVKRSDSLLWTVKMLENSSYANSEELQQGICST